jgi:hypothetical protein
VAALSNLVICVQFVQGGVSSISVRSTSMHTMRAAGGCIRAAPREVRPNAEQDVTPQLKSSSHHGRATCGRNTHLAHIMRLRYAYVAAVAQVILLLALRPIASAPLPLVPARSAFGRCDPSATRIDCGYYGATRTLQPADSSSPLTHRNQRNAMRAARLLLVTRLLRRHGRHAVVLHSEPAVARLLHHPPMQWPRLMHQRCLPVRFRLCNLLCAQCQ